MARKREALRTDGRTDIHGTKTPQGETYNYDIAVLSRVLNHVNPFTNCVYSTAKCFTSIVSLSKASAIAFNLPEVVLQLHMCRGKDFTYFESLLFNSIPQKYNALALCWQKYSNRHVNKLNNITIFFSTFNLLLKYESRTWYWLRQYRQNIRLLRTINVSK